MIGEFFQDMLRTTFDLSANTTSARGNKGVLLGAYSLVALPAGGINALGNQKQIDAPGPVGP